jgi:hypothetical protein
VSLTCTAALIATSKTYALYTMNKTIRLCYRKIIDSSSQKAWERLVFEDSYAEFKMQCQRFNEGSRFSSFGEMIANNPSAEQLHFLTGNTAAAYTKQLNGKIPDMLNTLGKHFLPFSNYRFEIINSDITDISKHKVAINFFSEPITWVSSIGEKIIVSINGTVENGELLTETLVLQPFVSIYSISQD